MHEFGGDDLMGVIVAISCGDHAFMTFGDKVNPN